MIRNRVFRRLSSLLKIRFLFATFTYQTTDKFEEAYVKRVIQTLRKQVLFTLIGLLLLVNAVFFAQSKQLVAQETALSFGETVSGSIVTPGQTITYTFQANAEDTILIGASRTSDDLWPRVRLYDPNGRLLEDKSSSIHVELVQQLPNRFTTFMPIIIKPQASKATSPVAAQSQAKHFSASTEGIYTIVVSDGFNGTTTGDYNLFIQRLNGPENTTDISFSQTLPGSIQQPAERDTFVFEAMAGDTVLIGMSRVAGELWQEIRLYDANGRLLNEERSSVHVENVYTVPETGRYTLLLGDGFNGTFTGSYNLFLQRLNSPANAEMLSFGQLTMGAIQQPAEMDAFTFTAQHNDTILIATSRVSGGLWQGIRLYDPDGHLLNEESSSVHAENVYTLPRDGTYLVLFADGFNGTFTGDYNLYIQRLNNPSQTTTISFGQTLSGAITQPAEMDTFTFSTEASTQVIIRMTRLDGGLWQGIRLYDADGKFLTEESGPTQAEITYTLPSGDYTVLAADGFNGTFTGEYTLHLQSLP